MKTRELLAALVLLMVAAACTSTLTAGDGLLPTGMDQARVPQAELGGFVYLSASPGVAVSTSRFVSSQGVAELPADVPAQVDIVGAILVSGTSSEEIGGTLTFATPEDAQTAWQVFEARKMGEENWGLLVSPRMHAVRGKGPWATSVRSALESGSLVPLSTHDPDAWALVTNLPEKPPSAPIAAGVVSLDDRLIEDFGAEAGFPLSDIADALGLAGVEAIAFALYSDLPSEAIESVDRDFLAQSGSAAMFVSHSSYHGAILSLVMRAGSGLSGLEEVELGDKTVRYRKIGDLHLVAKTEGSFIYAAVAAARDDAEKLILSAISD